MQETISVPRQLVRALAMHLKPLATPRETFIRMFITMHYRENPEAAFAVARDLLVHSPVNSLRYRVAIGEQLEIYRRLAHLDYVYDTNCGWCLAPGEPPCREPRLYDELPLEHQLPRWRDPDFFVRTRDRHAELTA